MKQNKMKKIKLISLSIKLVYIQTNLNNLFHINF